MAGGKKLLDTLPMEKKGVRAVQAIFENAGYTFQEVRREYDIGKDAYVDVREADDLFIGSMIALQIKSGPSFRHGEDYKIGCAARDRAIWARSTIPIYGMVYDPAPNTVCWVNLTDWARALRPGQTKSYCVVPRVNLLNEMFLPAWVERVRRETAAWIDPPFLGLMSPDLLDQRIAVGDCFARARYDSRAMELVRFALPSFKDWDALSHAIGALAQFTSHPEAHWTEKNWVPEEIQQKIRARYRWTLDETELLIEAVPGSAWGVGRIGQSVYHLVICDPECEHKLEQVVAQTMNEEVRFHAARVRVALAGGDGLDLLDRMIKAAPALAEEQLTTELRQRLLDRGEAPLY